MHLLYATLLVGMGTASFGVYGTIGSVVALVAWSLVGTTVKSTRTFGVAFLIVLGLVGIAEALICCYILEYPTDRSMQSDPHGYSSNLRDIASALHEYNDEFGTLPPARAPSDPDADGHSWRVTLLPDSGRDFSPRGYDFAAAWNAPSNREMIRWGQSPYVDDDFVDRTGRDKATALAVTGQDTLWDDERQLDIASIPDGARQTVMLVEWPDSDVVWTEPRDLPLEQAAALLSLDLDSPLVSRNQYYFSTELYGPRVALANDFVTCIRPGLTEQQVRSLCLVNDGGPTDVYAYTGPVTVSNSANWLRFIAFHLLMIAPIAWLARRNSRQSV